MYLGSNLCPFILVSAYSRWRQTRESGRENDSTTLAPPSVCPQGWIPGTPKWTRNNTITVHP